MIATLNKVILFLILPSSIFSFLAYNDIDRKIPYAREIMMVVAGLVALLLLFKTIGKWRSLRIISKRSNDLLYCEAVSPELRFRIQLYEWLDVGLYAALGCFLSFTAYPGFYLGVVLLAAALEGIVFLLSNTKRFRLAITSKAVILATNRPNVIRVARLRSVLNKSGDFGFEYRDGQVHKLETQWIQKSSRGEFISVLTRLVEEKGVFFDDFQSITSKE